MRDDATHPHNDCYAHNKLHVQNGTLILYGLDGQRLSHLWKCLGGYSWRRANCVREAGNQSDPYAVSVIKPQNELTIGHLPRKISSLCSMFLQQSGSISCILTGPKCFSHDLPQGGLEIPCQLKFTGNEKDVSKIQILAHDFLFKASSSNDKQNQLTEQKPNDKKPDENVITIDYDVIPAVKWRKISSIDQSTIKNPADMANEDLESIIMGCKLPDIHINHAQKLLKKTLLNDLEYTPRISWSASHFRTRFKFFIVEMITG